MVVLGHLERLQAMILRQMLQVLGSLITPLRCEILIDSVDDTSEYASAVRERYAVALAIGSVVALLR